MARRKFGANGAEFTFDPDSGELSGPRGKTRLRPQSATVLAALMERPGQLVTRAELKKRIWPDSFAEADQALTFCMRQVRVALGDDGDTPHFIETVARQGFRFIAQFPPAEKPASTEPRKSQAGFVIGLLALAAMGVVWFRQPEPAVGDATLMVGVMPFDTRDGERWMRELGREIAGQLVDDLSRSAQNIGVVGPSVTGGYVADARSPRVIGAELGVDILVSGTMHLSDSTLEVHGIQTSDGASTFSWRENVFDRGADSVVASLSRAFHTQVFGGTLIRRN